MLSKDVLTQAEALVALRTIAPQDREAIDAWIQAHDAHGQRAEFMASLASLPIGTAWFWSPGWLDVFKRVRVRARETFDSSATPKVGTQPRTPKQLAEVDLEGLKQRIAATIEKAKAENPRELRRRIAELEAGLRSAQHAQKSAPAAAPKRIEVPVLRDAQIKRLDALAARVDRALARLGEWAAAFTGTEREIRKVGAGIAAAIRAPRVAASPPSGTPSSIIPGRIRVPQPSPRAARDPGETTIGAGERKMLEALALRHPEPLSKAQLGLLAGYAASGGTFRTYLPRLHRAGLVEVRNDHVALTSEGRAAVGDIRHAPQTPEQVRSMWLGALDQGPRRMLEVLIGAYPKAVTKPELGEASGYEAAGGTFRTYLPKLRRLGLVEIDRDQVRASETLFL